ncbi:hypothetical protein VNO77_26655 [Canavalia gladiata]|uniref:Uncharacterized protein n=1 Tax=Canavalia gladiata TaxID=3824 RepID=A0AAN9KTZ5_CANGL
MGLAYQQVSTTSANIKYKGSMKIHWIMHHIHGGKLNTARNVVGCSPIPILKHQGEHLNEPHKDHVWLHQLGITLNPRETKYQEGQRTLGTLLPPSWKVKQANLRYEGLRYTQEPSSSMTKQPTPRHIKDQPQKPSSDMSKQDMSRHPKDHR